MLGWSAVTTHGQARAAVTALLVSHDGVPLAAGRARRPDRPDRAARPGRRRRHRQHRRQPADLARASGWATARVLTAPRHQLPTAPRSRRAGGAAPGRATGRLGLAAPRRQRPGPRRARAAARGRGRANPTADSSAPSSASGPRCAGSSRSASRSAAPAAARPGSSAGSTTRASTTGSATCSPSTPPGMLVRRSVLERARPRRAAAVFGNDLDFGWRAARAGHRTVVVPDAVRLPRRGRAPRRPPDPARAGAARPPRASAPRRSTRCWSTAPRWALPFHGGAAAARQPGPRPRACCWSARPARPSTSCAGLVADLCCVPGGCSRAGASGAGPRRVAPRGPAPARPAVDALPARARLRLRPRLGARAPRPPT